MNKIHPRKRPKIPKANHYAGMGDDASEDSEEQDAVRNVASRQGLNMEVKQRIEKQQREQRKNEGQIVKLLEQIEKS